MKDVMCVNSMFEGRKSAKEVALLLSEFHELEFGSKLKGRFQLSRSDFRKLARMPILKDSFIQDASDECLNLGLALISIGDIIAILEIGPIHSFRKLPKDHILVYNDFE